MFHAAIWFWRNESVAREAPTRESVPANRVIICVRSFSCASASLSFSAASAVLRALSRVSEPDSEPGLLALWNFEDGTARDQTPNGHDGMLIGQAQIVEAERPAPDAAVLLNETVLELDGTNSFVELPPGCFRDLEALTVDA